MSSQKNKPLISIALLVENSGKSYLNDAISSVTNQNFQEWELCIFSGLDETDSVKKLLEDFEKSDERVKLHFSKTKKGVGNLLHKAYDMTRGEFIGFLNQNDILHTNCLLEVSEFLKKNPDSDVVYTNEAQIQARKKKVLSVTEKPQWSPDLLLSTNYINNFFTARKKIIDKIGGISKKNEKFAKHDLLLKISEKTDKFQLIPKTLYYTRKTTQKKQTQQELSRQGIAVIKDALKRRGMGGVVENTSKKGIYKTTIRVNQNPRVSIIIPFRDKMNVLKTCLDSIFEKTEYKNYEIILMDNQSTEEDMLKYLEEVGKNKRIRVIKYDKPFNYASINNQAVKKSTGEYLLFLNNDTEVKTKGWIKELLGRCQQTHVGVVGAYLEFPSGKVQHAGVVMIRDPKNKMGLMFSNLHEKNQLKQKHIHTHVINCLAVTGACMMVKRKLFNKVAGFDEKLTVFFNDTDLCLKIRDIGYFITYTPYVRLIHYEGVSRGKKENDLIWFNHQYLNKKWGEKLDSDPYLNPMSSLYWGDLVKVK